MKYHPVTEEAVFSELREHTHGHSQIKWIVQVIKALNLIRAIESPPANGGQRPVHVLLSLSLFAVHVSWSRGQSISSLDQEQMHVPLFRMRLHGLNAKEQTTDTVTVRSQISRQSLPF